MGSIIAEEKGERSSYCKIIALKKNVLFMSLTARLLIFDIWHKWVDREAGVGMEIHFFISF